MAIKRVVTKEQSDLLSAMRTHRGVWHDNCGWHWGGAYNTVKCLDRLVKRGLVTVEEVEFPNKVFRNVYRIKEGT